MGAEFGQPDWEALSGEGRPQREDMAERWRAIAERGRYPAVNVLKSVSRTMPRAADPEFWPIIQRARAILSTYNDMEELIRLGAYREGTSPDVDEAIRLYPFINEFLSQSKEESTSLRDSYARLASVMASM